jgi:hypothetical protein
MDTIMLAAQPAGLSSTDALTTALTVEGLLLAAFGVSYSIATTPTRGGRSIFHTRAWFGWLIVATIAAVAISGAAAWWHLYGADPWPKHWNARLQIYGLALGIVLQPVFAAIINWEARKS